MDILLFGSEATGMAVRLGRRLAALPGGSAVDDQEAV